MLLHKNCANCSKFSILEELVLFGTTTNCTADKPIEVVILLSRFYVYKCKFQGSMPVLSVFQTIERFRYNTENYVSSILGENFALQNVVAVQ